MHSHVKRDKYADLSILFSIIAHVITDSLLKRSCLYGTTRKWKEMKIRTWEFSVTMFMECSQEGIFCSWYMQCSYKKMQLFYKLSTIPKETSGNKLLRCRFAWLPEEYSTFTNPSLKRFSFSTVYAQVQLILMAPAYFPYAYKSSLDLVLISKWDAILAPYLVNYIYSRVFSSSVQVVCLKHAGLSEQAEMWRQSHQADSWGFCCQVLEALK